MLKLGSDAQTDIKNAKNTKKTTNEFVQIAQNKQIFDARQKLRKSVQKRRAQEIKKSIERFE